MSLTIINALSGLGIFLFGMTYMEQALKEFAGVKFKQWIKNSTSNTFKAILTGAGATALLQSSGVVSLMALSFVSASLITLQSGIGLIFGANIGTTATAWIVAILGFKVKIEIFALPMIGFSGIILMFTRSQKLASIAKIFIGFGLLFFGLEIMKDAIEQSAKSINIADFSNYGSLFFVLFGIILTTLIQSSSATTAIVLSALSTNIITFDIAVAVVIGSNIGSTTTALLGSIGGVPDKKRVALAHFLFNFITALIAFVFIKQLSYIILEVFDFKTDLVTALALFHTIFNILGVIILSPFIILLANFLNSLFIEKKEIKTKFIHLVEPIESNGAMIAIRNEISNLFNKSIKYSLLLMNLKPNEIFEKTKDTKELLSNSMNELEFDYKRGYEILKEIEIESTKYLNKINTLPLNEEQTATLDILYNSLHESVYAGKILKDIKNNITEFSQSDDEKVLIYFNMIRSNLILMIQNTMDIKNKEINIDQIENKHSELIKQNRQFVNKLTRNFEKENINQKTIVSLLNTNRTVLEACNSFLEAAKIFDITYEIDTKDEF
jgi:phosphate:Na+ symporter